MRLEFVYFFRQKLGKGIFLVSKKLEIYIVFYKISWRNPDRNCWQPWTKRKAFILIIFNFTRVNPRVFDISSDNYGFRLNQGSDNNHLHHDDA